MKNYLIVKYFATRTELIPNSFTGERSQMPGMPRSRSPHTGNHVGFKFTEITVIDFIGVERIFHNDGILRSILICVTTSC